MYILKEKEFSGTLRDQITYPQTREEMLRRGKSDDDLSKHLERVQLGYLLQRPGGWDAIEDWIDVLSGGEKQRIAVSNFFFLLSMLIYILC